MLQVVFLLLVLLANHERTAAKPVDAAYAVGAVILATLVIGLFAELPAAWLTRRIWYDRPNRFRYQRRYHRVKFLHVLLSAAIYAAAVYGTGWDEVVRGRWGLGSSHVVSYLLLILPFVIGMLAAWAAFYRVELALHQTASSAQFVHPFWSRGEFVLFQARQNLGLVLAGSLVFVSLQELGLRLFPQSAVHPWAALFMQGGVVLLVMLLLPWLLTVVWPTRSLPGPLRHQLAALARRHGFRCTDIRLWDTNSCVANAMVTGLLPVPRYVLLSDLLVEALHPEEIEAVFGHEMGHVRHWHIPLFMVFLMLSSLLFVMAAEPFLTWLDEHWNWSPILPGLGSVELGSWAANGLVLVGLLVYLWLVFGRLSQWCERQADLYGCRVVPVPPAGGPMAWLPAMNGKSAAPSLESDAPAAPAPTAHGVRVFVSALLKVANLNGIDPNRPSWRHGSIASRVRFLESLLDHPEREAQFQRRFLWLKLGLILTLAGLIGLFWWLLGGLPLN